MIIDGLMATIYVRIDSDSRIDIWESSVRLRKDEILGEMLEEKEDILQALATNTEDYGGYNYEGGDEDPNNEEYFESFQEMIDEIRDNPETGIDDSFEDVDIVIRTKKVHLPQLTEYEWAKICEGKGL